MIPPRTIGALPSRARVLAAVAAVVAGSAVLTLLVAAGQASGVLIEGRDPPTAHAAVMGKILFAHQGDIWVVEDGNLHPVTNGGRYWGQPDWSPDGSRIALVGWTDNASDLFVMNADGSEVRQITQSRKRRLQDSEWAFFPRWAPDGETLGYTMDRSSQYPMLWVSRWDGASARQLTRATSGLDGIESFSWSPDGALIAMTRFDQRTSQVHIVSLARPGPTQAITNEPGGAFDPAWSPDGRYIAYAARSGRKTSIKVHDTTGLNAPVTLVDAELARSPRWAPNGSALAYIGLAGREFELHVVDVTADADGVLSAGRPLLLTSRFGVDATSGLSWAP